MEKDDIILLSSDGLFDNMEDHEIEKLVEEVKKKQIFKYTFFNIQILIFKRT